MTDAPLTTPPAPLSTPLKVVLVVLGALGVAALVVTVVLLLSGAPADTPLASDNSPTEKPVVVVDPASTPTATPTPTPTVGPVVEAAPAAPAAPAPAPPAAAPAPVVGVTSFTVAPAAGYSLPASCSASSVPIVISWTTSGLLPTLELQQWGSYSSARPNWQDLPSTGSVTATFPCTQTDWELLASDGTTRYTAKLILTFEGAQSWSYI